MSPERGGEGKRRGETHRGQCGLTQTGQVLEFHGTAEVAVTTIYCMLYKEQDERLEDATERVSI